VEKAFYFDVHGHREGLLPKALRLIPGSAIPADVRLSEVAAAGVAGFVLCVLGDPNSFIPVKVDTWRTLRRDLAVLQGLVAPAGGRVAHNAGELEGAAADGVPAFVLGIEGGDFLGEDLSKLDAVYELGVRLVGLVHYSKNSLGSISFGWGGKIIPVAERTGLSDFGKSVLRRAGELGLMIDLAHSDDETIRGALDQTTAPLICSHTGPRSLQDFPRYIPDDLIKEIAAAGGLIGLWPFFSRGRGVVDLVTFAEYAAHCADLVGPASIAIGSDINGVPGNMSGYENLFDSPKIVRALSDRGFTDGEVAGIVGRNFLRFFTGMKG
jgi:membrane dipeptidase